MAKLTTAIIKQELSTQGYTNTKRVSKKKDASGDVLREFSSSQGNILVRSDASDTVILAINPVSLANSQTAPAGPTSSLVDLIEIKAPMKISDHLDTDQEQELEDVINSMGASKFTIYIIPEINNTKPSGYGRNWYETFLVKTDVGDFVWDSHYIETMHLSTFHTTPRNINGVWIDTDFELIDPSSWMEINIPTSSYIKYADPEYMKVIALSDDLTQGITSVGYGNESTVDTLKNDLINIGFAQVDSTFYFADDPVAFGKMYQKYDFVNTNM